MVGAMNRMSWAVGMLFACSNSSSTPAESVDVAGWLEAHCKWRDTLADNAADLPSLADTGRRPAPGLSVRLRLGELWIEGQRAERTLESVAMRLKPGLAEMSGAAAMTGGAHPQPVVVLAIDRDVSGRDVRETIELLERAGVHRFQVIARIEGAAVPAPPDERVASDIGSGMQPPSVPHAGARTAMRRELLARELGALLAGCDGKGVVVAALVEREVACGDAAVALAHCPADLQRRALSMVAGMLQRGDPISVRPVLLTKDGAGEPWNIRPDERWEVVARELFARDARPLKLVGVR